MLLKKIVFMASVLLGSAVQAQSQLPSTGTLVAVPASGQVTHANDEVTVTFSVEESGKDKAEVASRANRKMKEGIAILRAQDPTARLKSGAYNTYAQYKKDKLSSRETVASPVEIIGWQIVVEVKVTTQDLAALPKMAAAVQDVLGLSHVNFHLTEATIRKLDDQRIAATYQNLNERIASIASAMGRQVSNTTIESVEFDGAGARNNYSDFQRVEVTGSRLRKEDLAEPSFEAGETTLQMNLVGRVRFK